MDAPRSAGDFKASLIPTPPLAVSSFMPRGTATPGDVAVCLCGGGSRAMVAGMGQLLALQALTLGAGGPSLLSQTKVLSTVSGGSWVGVPFTYLPKATSDTSFLGGPYTEPGALTVSGLATFPAGCVASHITSGVSFDALAVEGLVLVRSGAVRPDMVWQTLMGIHFLSPYGLYQVTSPSDATPASYFSYDTATAAAIKEANAGTGLQIESVNLVAQVSGQSRPFLLCNMAMSVDDAGLVPVHGTPFFTGIVSSPPGATDANGRLVGGGGVTSFAFNSEPAKVEGEAVAVRQERQWSLIDILGTSSAWFADGVISSLEAMVKRSPRLAAALHAHRDEALARIARSGLDTTQVTAFVEAHLQAARKGNLQGIDFDTPAIVPAYRYWSVTGVEGGEAVKPSYFTDAGSLDNTGIASALAYTDVRSVIAFMNAETPLSKDAAGNIVVEFMIPPLFGYCPYDPTQGYVPIPAGSTQPYAHNQIFPSEAFQPLLAELWKRSGSGMFQESPLVRQSLTTVANPWFGVAGGATIEVLWVYLESTATWSRQLSTEVGDTESQLVVSMGFPHYSTTTTQLTATESNLLANLTAWTVTRHADAFLAMYRDAAAPAR